MLFYYEEKKIQEISHILDCSEGTVKSRLNSAKKLIKNAVEKEERKGNKLYTVAPIPVLGLLLRKSAEECKMPNGVSNDIFKEVKSSLKSIKEVSVITKVATIIKEASMIKLISVSVAGLAVILATVIIVATNINKIEDKGIEAKEKDILASTGKISGIENETKNNDLEDIEKEDENPEGTEKKEESNSDVSENIVTGVVSNNDSSSSSAGNSNSDRSSNNSSGSSSGGNSTGGNSGSGSSSGGDSKPSTGGGSSSGGSSGGGTTPNPTHNPTPTPDPTPDPTPKPEPEPVYGLSPSQIEGRMAGLGMRYDADNSGYGIKVYKSASGGTSIAISGSSVEISLYTNSAIDASIVKQVLTMALPTAGGEVYSIVSKPFSNQTITRDGRSVELWNAHVPVVKIYY